MNDPIQGAAQIALQGVATLQEQNKKLVEINADLERALDKERNRNDLLRERLDALAAEHTYYMAFSTEMATRANVIGENAREMVKAAEHSAYRPSVVAPPMAVAEQPAEPPIPSFLTERIEGVGNEQNRGGAGGATISGTAGGAGETWSNGGGGGRERNETQRRAEPRQIPRKSDFGTKDGDQ